MSMRLVPMRSLRPRMVCTACLIGADVRRDLIVSVVLDPILVSHGRGGPPAPTDGRSLYPRHLRCRAPPAPLLLINLLNLARMVHLAQNSSENSPIAGAVHEEFACS